MLVLAVAAIVGAVLAAYSWTQSHYYVGDDNGQVAIFQGVQQSIGPIHLSSVYQSTRIDVSSLPDLQRQQRQGDHQRRQPARRLEHRRPALDGGNGD